MQGDQQIDAANLIHSIRHGVAGKGIAERAGYRVLRDEPTELCVATPRTTTSPALIRSEGRLARPGAKSNADTAALKIAVIAKEVPSGFASSEYPETALSSLP